MKESKQSKKIRKFFEDELRRTQALMELIVECDNLEDMRKLIKLM